MLAMADPRLDAIKKSIREIPDFPKVIVFHAQEKDHWLSSGYRATYRHSTDEPHLSPLYLSCSRAFPLKTSLLCSWTQQRLSTPSIFLSNI